MKKGFTLIELLIVIAIIGIIAGISMVFLGGAKTSARDKAVHQQLKSLGTQMEVLADTIPPEIGYSGLCSAPTVKNIVNGIVNADGLPSGYCFGPGDYPVISRCGCADNPGAWAFWIKLSGNSEGQVTCIDNNETGMPLRLQYNATINGGVSCQ